MYNLARLSNQFLDQYWMRKSLKLKFVKKFLSYPEPYEIGSIENGRLLISGTLNFNHQNIKIPNHSLWEIEINDPILDQHLHGFSWLNDLAAVGTFDALKLAQEWVFQWISMDLKDKNRIWSLEILTERLFNWINHSSFLLKTQHLNLSDSYMISIEQQAFYLEKRWKSLQTDITRFKAITSLISVGIYLTDKNYLVKNLNIELDKEIVNTFDMDGGIYSRDPNSLAQIFALLIWLEILLGKINLNITDTHSLIIKKVAPNLRSLRHSDGALIGFRGRAKISDKYLDRALIHSGVKHRLPDRNVMGYARLGNKRMSIFIDTGGQLDSIIKNNFLETKSAIEITINKCPFVVSGIKMIKQGGLSREDKNKVYNASALKLGNKFEHNVDLQPSTLEWDDGEAATELKVSHTGYLRETGLTYIRMINLDNDETKICGEDSFNAISEESRFKFEDIFKNQNQNSIMSIAFLLHPEVLIEQEQASVNFLLKNKERYALVFSDKYDLKIEEGYYCEDSNGKLCATKQVVLSSHLMNYDNCISWNIIKI